MTTDVEDDDSDPELKTFRQFAAARSNQDSKLSNENSRAAAQAAIEEKRKAKAAKKK